MKHTPSKQSLFLCKWRQFTKILKLWRCQSVLCKSVRQCEAKSFSYFVSIIRLLAKNLHNITSVKDLYIKTLHRPFEIILCSQIVSQYFNSSNGSVWLKEMSHHINSNTELWFVVLCQKSVFMRVCLFVSKRYICTWHVGTSSTDLKLGRERRFEWGL